MAFAASGILGIAAVVLLITLGGRGDESRAQAASGRAALKNAGCTLQTFKDQGRNHIGLNTEDPASVKAPKYNSTPPTSGPHYSVPAIWDFYDTPVLPIQEVHNLEHGGVVIHYGSGVASSEVDKIREFYEEDTEALLVAPLPSLGNKITLSAWTKLATCPRFDEGAFRAFVDEYRYHGPESNQIPKGSSVLKRGNA